MKQPPLKTLLLLLLLFIGSVNTNSQPKAEALPKPSLTIASERANIRENETLLYTILIANDSDKSIESNKLEIVAPKFLKWFENSCEGASKNEFDFGEIKPHSIIKKEICTKLDSSFKVGDFNLLFILKYSATVNNTKEESFLIDQKTLKTDVFGANEIAGIPFAFAVFVVPGLFFLGVLRLGKVPCISDLQTDEKLVLSILVSIGCLALASILKKLAVSIPFLGYFSLDAEVSVGKLLAFAGIGVILGGVVLLGYWGYERQKKNQEETQRKNELAKLIKPTDMDFALVSKILELNSDYKGIPVSIKLENGEEYGGSHFAKTVDTTFLVGAFKIDEQKLQTLPADVRQKIREVESANEPEGEKIKKILELIKGNPELVELVSPIQSKTAQNRIATTKKYLAIDNEDISLLSSDYSNEDKLLTIK